MESSFYRNPISIREIGEKWSISLRLLLLMCFRVCQAAGALYKAIYCVHEREKEIQRETED